MEDNILVGNHRCGELFQQYYLPIRRYLQSKVNDRDIAEELTAETFERVVRFHHSYKEENVGGWLRIIARNTFINHYRREKRIREAGQHITDTGEDCDTISHFSRGTDPEQITIQKIGLEEMVQILQTTIPPLYQETVFLRELEGFSYQEIAEKLAIPLGTVMSRLHRGRKYFPNETSYSEPEAHKQENLREGTALKAKRRDFGNDPVAYYQQHHAGLTRTQLADQNPKLYRRLLKDRLLDHIPRKRTPRSLDSAIVS